ncbi:MAG: endonuclease/exonuclease/phosphatase family protein [Saprospiraceae bacterium]
MPISVLSWNMYYGNLPNSTPVQRFNHIAQIAANNNIDVVLLQEHPGITSNFVHPNGLLNGAVVPPNYQYQVIQEMNANIHNRASASNRAYAILFRNTCALANTSYFNQNNFILPTQSYLRCPVQYQITHNYINYNLFNWHNETGNWAADGINIFTQQALPPNTILIGDLNLTAHNINGIHFFNNWYDVVAAHVNHIFGVDHILSLLYCNPIIGNQLNFISDANHFPIAANVN